MIFPSILKFMAISKYTMYENLLYFFYKNLF